MVSIYNNDAQTWPPSKIRYQYRRQTFRKYTKEFILYFCFVYFYLYGNISRNLAQFGFLNFKHFYFLSYKTISNNQLEGLHLQLVQADRNKKCIYQGKLQFLRNINIKTSKIQLLMQQFTRDLHKKDFSCFSFDSFSKDCQVWYKYQSKGELWSLMAQCLQIKSKV